MAAKKDLNGAMPMTPETDTTPSAKITYANEVVAIIAGLAANEVEGIAGMCSVSGNILNKNRNVTKGVKVEIGTEEAAVEAGDSEPEKLSEPDPVKPAAEESTESKSAKQNRNKNSKPKKEKTENPEEEKPAEEV